MEWPTGEGAGPDGKFKESEGTGMGEGEGARDVSDQIEDEDQLLGAQQAGAEQPEQPDQVRTDARDLPAASVCEHKCVGPISTVCGFGGCP